MAMFWISGGTNHSRLSPAGWAFILPYGSPPSAISISAVIIVINMLAMGNEWINLSPTHKGEKENEGKKMVWMDFHFRLLPWRSELYIIILPSPDARHFQGDFVIWAQEEEEKGPELLVIEFDALPAEMRKYV